MTRILVADKLSSEGMDRLRAADGVTVEERIGLDIPALAACVGEFDGMIIRSGVKVTADVLAHPGQLKVIARAGVGVDNVDLDAATRAGVLVMNTPDANTLSTAEHTIAMMMAAMRHIPAAHAHVAAGSWDRKAFLGRQLAGKTLGLIGLGRVGRAVAERALAMQMKVIAHDPFISAETALDGRVLMKKHVSDLLPLVDLLTLHASLSDDTRNMIGAKQLASMKPTAVLINCARGALVDDAALAVALNDGVIAGAALDVFPEEPPTGCPLLSAKNVVLTPHLGASTEEAQIAVAVDAVDSMLDYLLNGTIRNAVNVSGLPANLTERDRADLDLVSRMGRILSPLCKEGLDSVDLMTYGDDRLSALAPTLAMQALVNLMNPHIDGRLNLVNVRSFAEERGIPLRHTAHSERRAHHDTIVASFRHGDRQHEIEGAVFSDARPRILAIDGYRMELAPEGALVLIFNDDRPGVIGVVGSLFGDHAINIADMALSRREKMALMVLKVDGDVPEPLIDQLRDTPSILSVRVVRLPAL